MQASRHSWQRKETNGKHPNPPFNTTRPSYGRRVLWVFAAVIAVVVLTAAVATAWFATHGPADGGPSDTDSQSRSTGRRTADAVAASSAAVRPAAVTDSASTSAPDAASSSTSVSPRVAASSWSAGPTPVAPAPAPEITPPIASIAKSAERLYGVQIALDGQDWGEGEASQTANVRAVISAIDKLPDTVISAVVSHPNGPLTFVSNNQGRTAGGWQPYGAHAMAYYTNSDVTSKGGRPSNQVVLTVGATSMSVGHEILHAYQFRNVGPDQYALALLQPEMRSFMAAAGWRQTGTDAQVRAAVDQPWSALNGLYVYEGRTLTYVTEGGMPVTVSPTNPIEAFATAGSVYYTRPSWTPLPDWPEYWDWFAKNVG